MVIENETYRTLFFYGESAEMLREYPHFLTSATATHVFNRCGIALPFYCWYWMWQQPGDIFMCSQKKKKKTMLALSWPRFGCQEKRSEIDYLFPNETTVRSYTNHHWRVRKTVTLFEVHRCCRWLTRERTRNWIRSRSKEKLDRK